MKQGAVPETNKLLNGRTKIITTEQRRRKMIKL